LLASDAAATEAWENEELQAAVHRAIESLPERSRAVVTLHYLAEMSYEEIGQYLKVSVQTVRGRLYRACEQLEAALTGNVEESFAKLRLPESFSKGVIMKKLTLHPIEEGWVSSALSPEVKSLILGATQPEGEAALIALAMHPADAEAILPGLAPGDKAVRARIRAFDSFRQILEALHIHLRRVELYLAEGQQCRARVMLKQGRKEWTLDLRPSDALALAARLKAPLYADQAVVQQGKVGEDGLECRLEGSLESLRAELLALHQQVLMQDKAFEIGLAPEAGRDTVRFSKEEATGTLRMEVPGSESNPLLLGLDKHRLGIRHMWVQAQHQPYTDYRHDDGRRYKVCYTVRGEDTVEIRFVPVATDQQA